MRWVFAMIGFVYGRFIGGVFGYWMGYLLEQSMARKRIGVQSERGGQMRVDILQDFLTLTMAVARADGQIDRREIRAIRSFFESSMGFSGESLTWLKDALKSESQYPGDWRQAADRLRRTLTPLDLTVLMRTLIHVAQADGVVDENEHRLLQEIANVWGMLGPQFDAWQEPAGQQKNRSWAFGILGLTQQVSKDEIDRAYKKLVREKHPDRFAHLGDEFQKEAHEQFVEIQEAYRILST